MDVFAWLSESQSRYLAVSNAALFAFAALVVAGLCSRRFAAFLAARAGTGLVFGGAFAALLASRWPTLFLEVDFLDNDTAEYIAQAIQAIHRGIPWRDFDGLTSGPFDTYVVTLPALFGFHLNFETTDVVTIVLQFLAIAATYGAFAECFDAAVARLAIVPPLLFWSITTHDEFVYYSSGLLSVTLIAGMLWLLAYARRRGCPPQPLLIAGVFAGLLPFAKLQSGPIAVAVSIATLLVVAFAPGLPRRRKRDAVLAFVAGVVVIPVATLGVALAGGSLSDFWMSYILSSIGYIITSSKNPAFLLTAPEFGPYLMWLAGAGAIGAIVAAVRPDAGPRSRTALAIAWLVLGVSIYCIYAPGRETRTYLQFAVIPAALAGGCGLAAVLAIARSRFARLAVGCAFMLTAFVIGGGAYRAENTWAENAYAHYRAGGDADPLVADIAARIEPGERLAIWGYRPRYFVFTQTLLGTRDATAVNQYTVYPNPYQQYYKDRYINDMKANRPEGFLDAGPDSWNPTNAATMDGGYESWPELAAIVRAGYVQVAQWNRYRFFVRKDLAHRKLAAVAR